MNERIKELARLAGGRSTYGTLRGPIVPPPPGWFDHTTVDLEKFAELLIKECANIARQAESDNSDDYKSGRIWASLDILEHFGV